MPTIRKLFRGLIFIIIFSLAPSLLHSEEKGGNADKSMVLIPAGCFNAGSENGADDEKPMHKSCIGELYIDVNEVSYVDYQECVKAGKCTQTGQEEGCSGDFKDSGLLPVNCVTWEQAKTPPSPTMTQVRPMARALVRSMTLPTEMRPRSKSSLQTPLGHRMGPLP